MIVRLDRTKGEQSFMNGLNAADSKGYAAAEDVAFTERDNPYRRYEHRRCWLEGFRRRRAMPHNPSEGSADE